MNFLAVAIPAVIGAIAVALIKVVPMSDEVTEPVIPVKKPRRIVEL